MAVNTFLRIVIALLLFAQQAALSHAVWHAHGQLPAQQQSLANPAFPNAPAAPDASSLCMFDAAFGQVLGGALVLPHYFLRQVTNGETPLHWQRAVTVPEFLAPLSRGPPSLL